MKKIAIVVPVYNRLSITKQGLSVLKSGLRYYETNASIIKFTFDIVVVDDGSTDGTGEWIKKKYPLIHVLNGGGNLWWTGSVDLGSKYAVYELKSDFVLLWNDDTECELDYFLILTQYLSKFEDQTNNIVVSKVLWQDEKSKIFNCGCKFNKYTGQKTLIGYNCIDDGSFERMQEVDWSGGMGTILPSKLLKGNNFFDYAYFPQYHGDSDFFLRAKSNGARIWVVPQLKIYNNRSTTGLNKIIDLKSLKEFYFSNRSNYNILQNWHFLWRHSPYPLAFIRFLYQYFTGILKVIIKLILK